MQSVPISEFKAKCLRIVEDVRRTGVPIEVTKRGKIVAILNPPPKDDIDWTPGAFKNETRIIGDIQGDLADLGVRWDASQ